MKNNNNNNNNNINVVPVITYFSAFKDKFLIYKDNNKKSGIYRWNNLITNESYIGCSISLTNRFYHYYSKKAMLNNNTNSIIYYALLEYGYSNFSLDILEYCEKDILTQREQYYINILKPEYNILKIGKIKSKISIKKQINRIIEEYK